MQAGMNQDKRVLRVLICSTALSFGGEQKQLVKLLHHMDRERFQPVVCCIRPYGYIDPAITDSGVEIICLRVLRGYNLLKAVRGLCRVIKEQNIDLVQMGIFGAEFAGIIAAMVRHVPVVASLTSMYDLKERLAMLQGKRFPQILKWKLIFLVHGILSRIANVHYIAYSKAIKESAVKNLHLPANRIEIVPLGINLDDFHESRLSQEAQVQLRNELNLVGAYPVLLNVGRLAPVKGQKALLEVMPRILKQFPKAKLLIAGDGPLQEEFTKLRDDLGLQDHVHLLGRRDDIAALLTVSDFFVFSSYYEGLPGAVIEAMAAGKPVVAFDIPSLREVIEDKITGFLVSGRDVEKFGEAVIQLANDNKNIIAMGERAKQITQNTFDIRQNVKKLEELYEKVGTFAKE